MSKYYKISNYAYLERITNEETLIRYSNRKAGVLLIHI